MVHTSLKCDKHGHLWVFIRDNEVEVPLKNGKTYIIHIRILKCLTCNKTRAFPMGDDILI